MSVRQPARWPGEHRRQQAPHPSGHPTHTGTTRIFNVSLGLSAGM